MESEGWEARGWEAGDWRLGGWRLGGWRLRGWEAGGWEAGGWRLGGWRLGSIWEASGSSLEAPGGSPGAQGLQMPQREKKLHTSQLKCKTSFFLLILRCVFEGQVHQVP